MIVADLTIWSAALRGRDRAFESLFTALYQRGELAAPGLVFAQLLAEHEEANDAARLRTWALGTPAVDEPRAAWMAVGDLAGHLAGLGLHLSLTDATTLVLCLREDWPLWSLNPRFDEIGRRVPLLRRYQPSGL
jgi:predicted nucleic acid-binding protein